MRGWNLSLYSKLDCSSVAAAAAAVKTFTTDIMDNFRLVNMVMYTWYSINGCISCFLFPLYYCYYYYYNNYYYYYYYYYYCYHYYYYYYYCYHYYYYFYYYYYYHYYYYYFYYYYY